MDAGHASDPSSRLHSGDKEGHVTIVFEFDKVLIPNSDYETGGSHAALFENMRSDFIAWNDESSFDILSFVPSCGLPPSDTSSTESETETSSTVIDESSDSFWIDYMNYLMSIHDAKGCTVDDIRVSLSKIKVDAKLSQFIRDCSQRLNITLVIVSEVNDFFISEILKANDLDEAFDFVLANHASVVGLRSPRDRKLIVRPFVDMHGLHNCRLCPSSMCKTAALLEAIPELSREGHAGKVIYVSGQSLHYDICIAKHVLGPDDLILMCSKHPIAHRLQKRKVVYSSMLQKWPDYQHLTRKLRIATSVVPLTIPCQSHIWLRIADLASRIEEAEFRCHIRGFK